MGTNPRALNADLTGVYFDNRGDVACIVHADNDDFSAHNYPGLTRFTLAYLTFASAGQPLNFRGTIKHLALSKIVLANVQAQHPIAAAIIQNRIDAFEAWIADVASKKAAYETAFNAFVNSLTTAHKTALNAITGAASLLTFLNSLSAAERAAYDAQVAARQAYADALLAGPNP